MTVGSKIKSIDFYRKIPRDLTEATLSGATLSILAAIVMISLFVMEFSEYMTVKTHTSIIVDRSLDGDLLRINFDVSFPNLSCEFASVDVSDTLGTHRINLTKTVRKYQLGADLVKTGGLVRNLPEPKYEALEEKKHEEHKEEHRVPGDNSENAIELTAATFDEANKKYPILLVNFYAPWCPWSRRLSPVWESASAVLLRKFPHEDGRIRLGKVDCTVHNTLCRSHHIQGFPSVRIFRSGHDILAHGAHHDHESYVGDRTTEAIVEFAEKLVPPAITSEAPEQAQQEIQQAAAEIAEKVLKVKGGAPGCNVEGFVLVKKVPGNVHISAHSHQHSFDHVVMNMSHIVNHLSFGNQISVAKEKEMKRLDPEALLNAQSNRLKGKAFISESLNVTHEHYLQVVLTTVEPRGNKYNRVDLYEYTHHSHHFQTEGMPLAKFSFDPSPMQVLITEEKRKLYHFVTTACAIIGGVFTVMGITDSSIFMVMKLVKKVELGKQF
ncbi:Protein disulfide-isomerase 5-4 [Cymbomonas tetramitiformis]|uniref:Protein disulfide-isomerase 5-4 n=1 Tax=Cymbomonas tetramitiformis TaxID=36881 RepID=A0AAE0L6J9_9CHLO|nr:Protein disulfide-isomerase 5-4 [Cymbomonas tetramitiformis]|eukprot:gene4889-5971_t